VRVSAVDWNCGGVAAGSGEEEKFESLRFGFSCLTFKV